MNLKQILEITASEAPQRTALVLGSQRVTYGELDEAANRVANALIGLGVKKGDHVALLMSHCPEWVANYFGIIKAGGVAVLLSHMLKAPEHDALLRDSDSKIFITNVYTRFYSEYHSFLKLLINTGNIVHIQS